LVYSLVFLYTKYTGWRQNDFNVHAYLDERLVVVEGGGHVKFGHGASSPEPEAEVALVDVKAIQTPLGIFH
jgi:hypothetical protein